MNTNCPVCDKNLTRGSIGRHFHTKHPEYKWSRTRREGNVGKHYYCGICGNCLGSFGVLVQHYKDRHPEAIPRHLELRAVPQTIEGEILSVTHLDRLLEQVNINTGLLEQAREKNRELLEKCTSYASRIVELQNQLAQETKERY